MPLPISNHKSNIQVISRLTISDSISEAEQAFLSAHYQIVSDADWQLAIKDNIMTIINQQTKLSWGIDLTQGKYRHRQQTHNAKEPLLRAIKINGKLPKQVVDMTAGALKDAFLMHSRGISVTCVERNPLLYTLQKHAIANAKVDMTLYFADAIDSSPSLNAIIKNADLIYLDPMYPPSKKSAAVKKEMQALHAIVGLDNDADALLKAALKHNKRTVVKRPESAAYLADQKPNFSSQLGNTRYDVYF